MEGTLSLVQGWADVVVVLGAGVRKRKLSAEARARVAKACKLIDQGYAPLLVCSGGAHEGDISEAKAMRSYALSHGVQEGQVLLEERSLDTIGNAVFTKELLEQRRLRKAILVTGAPHMRRALALFSHICGPHYAVVGVASSPPLHERFMNLFRELGLREIETLLLSAVSAGDHAHAKELLLAHLPMYRNQIHPQMPHKRR